MVRLPFEMLPSNPLQVNRYLFRYGLVLVHIQNFLWLNFFGYSWLWKIVILWFKLNCQLNCQLRFELILVDQLSSNLSWPIKLEPGLYWSPWRAPLTLNTADNEGFTMQSETSIGKTVNYMFKRELHRVSNGHYKKSLTEEVWTLAVILWFASLVGLVIWGSYGISYYLNNWKSLTLITFLFPLSIYVFLKISLIMRWTLYWILGNQTES